MDSNEPGQEDRNSSGDCYDAPYWTCWTPW